jgi:hypothetical protein
MGKRLPRPAPTGIEQLIQRVGDATGINREMSRRDFLKKVGGATLAGVAKKALGPLPEAEQAAAALAPVRQPRLLSDSVAAAFKDIPDGMIAAYGPSKVVYNGHYNGNMTTADYSRLEQMMQRARDAAPNAPEGVVSYWNPLTNQWHQRVWKNIDPADSAAEKAFRAAGIPPEEMPEFGYKGAVTHLPANNSAIKSGGIYSTEGLYGEHYLPAGESLDPRLDISPWDNPESFTPGSWHSETKTESYLPKEIEEQMFWTKGGLTGGQIPYERADFADNLRSRKEWSNRPDSQHSREEARKIAQDHQAFFNTPYGAVLRPGEPQPSGMSYGPLEGILLDEPEQPSRRGRAFTKGIRNSLYGAGTAAVLSQLLDENEDSKERY